MSKASKKQQSTRPKGPAAERDLSAVVREALPPLPSYGRSRHFWVERLAPLVEVPGEWFRIMSTTTYRRAKEVSVNLRSGRITLPPGFFEFTGRPLKLDKAGKPVESAGSAVFGRFLGLEPPKGPHIGTSKRKPSFYKWLAKQVDHGGDVGQLALYARDDADWPRNGRFITLDYLKRYVEKLDDVEASWLEQAWREYEKQG